MASFMSPRDALVKLQTRLGVPSAVKIIDALISDRERAGLQQAQAALARCEHATAIERFELPALPFDDL